MSNSKPLILVCNDDGIFSPGIKALAEVASEFGEVVVVAPDRQQSAVGHAITMSVPLRANEMTVAKKYKGFAVNGTPADCVKLAHGNLLDRKPDLVLSGINHGSNAGINILYSGTVSAATEGTILAPEGEFKGIQWSRMADSRYVEEYEDRVDPFNRAYYWLTGQFELLDEGNDSDIHILNEGNATVTPIQYDLTDYNLLKEFGEEDL